MGGIDVVILEGWLIGVLGDVLHAETREVKKNTISNVLSTEWDFFMQVFMGSPFHKKVVGFVIT